MTIIEISVRCEGEQFAVQDRQMGGAIAKAINAFDVTFPTADEDVVAQFAVELGKACVEFVHGEEDTHVSTDSILTETLTINICRI
jgi:hypothetical protein